MKKVFLLLMAAVLVVSGCRKKEVVLTINGWERYQDQYTSLSFTHPQGWFTEHDGGSVSFYSSQAEANNFVDLAGGGKSGAKLSVGTQKNDSLITLENYVSSRKTDLANAGFEVSAVEPGTLGNLPAFTIRYQGFVTGKDKMGVAEICTMQDSIIYTVTFEAFNAAFEQTVQAFDSATTSIVLPEKKFVKTDVDPSIPATERKTYENKVAGMSIPANFDGATLTPKAPTEFTFEIRGYRQDCYIRVDVMPAQKLSAEKIIEQNSKHYKYKSKGQTTIDGVKTTYLNYSVMKDVQSRVYFLVKNDKFYRIIFNYYAPMKADYIPAFESSIASLRIK